MRPVDDGADHQHLGMGGGVVQLLDPVVVGGQHLAGGGIDQDRADRHLVARGRRLGLAEGEAHEIVLQVRVGLGGHAALEPGRCAAVKAAGLEAGAALF